MTQLTVTPPALSGLIHPGNCFPMTLYAICLNNFSSMGRKGDRLGNAPRVEIDHVLHPVDRFPDIVFNRITIGEVAVDTFYAAVGTGMSPGRVLIFHDVTARAEVRRFRFGKELGRAEEDEQHDGQSGKCRQNKSYNETFGYPKSHNLSPFPLPGCPRLNEILVAALRQ